MPAALRLVSGTRGTDGPSRPPTPQEAAARRLVERWLDTPFPDTSLAIDDLVARIARALARPDLVAVD